jgi:hypothetical protein
MPVADFEEEGEMMSFDSFTQHREQSTYPMLSDEEYLRLSGLTICSGDSDEDDWPDDPETEYWSEVRSLDSITHPSALTTDTVLKNSEYLREITLADDFYHPEDDELPETPRTLLRADSRWGIAAFWRPDEARTPSALHAA